MHRILVASLALAFSFSALGGSALAQTGAEPGASSAPAVEPAGATTPDLRFVAPKWRKLATDGGPAAREDHTWTVDHDGRFAYVFGGRDGGREFGDLWRYDLVRDVWKRLSPRGRTPAPRFGHNALWVEGRGLIVFAGQQGSDFFDDLWVFDPEKERWRELPARGQVPKRRYGSCMVVGPDGRLWISHGFTSSGRFDDTRAYNLKTRRWAVITPDGRKPGERCLHDCFTSAAGDLVLYGGQDDGNFALGDLWSLGQDRSWDRHQDPPAKWRRLYGVTEAGASVYLFGGAGEDQANLADLWRVDRETLEFELVRIDGNHPAARLAGTLVTDLERGRLLLFGGQADAGAKSDVWELVETAVPEAEPASAEPDAESATPEPLEDPSDE
jgi:hypothetical protein